eukprot:CAMPEP_0177653808 /NCGR_PEP_ID=MMETSP0447-20121125/13948_1 /TAXON_ID=0 /ORGANISM="Stygamoeba regulata, Strain BSH-02190019" /LENGTH=123 /DNA_ID=CAMNT_0019157319 /DNA_START=292 /DNA_END=663 /DNA_ORIENTATION=+
MEQTERELAEIDAEIQAVNERVSRIIKETEEADRRSAALAEERRKSLEAELEEFRKSYLAERQEETANDAGLEEEAKAWGERQANASRRLEELAARSREIDEKLAALKQRDAELKNPAEAGVA